MSHPDRPEPMLFSCSCQPGTYGFKLYNESDLHCLNCGTIYSYTRGKLTVREKNYKPDGTRSYAINVEWPA